MNANLRRMVSGIAALGIALSGMALGAGSAWAGDGKGDSVIEAGSVAIDKGDVTGTITISGSEVEHTFNGYRLGYLTSISYDEITDVANASMTGYTLETNQDYKGAIETALGKITDTKATGDNANKTLKDRYLTDENYCGSDCHGTGDPNPLGWLFANYGSRYEDDANWGGDAKDGTSDTVLRKFATEVSKALSNATATYSGDEALNSSEEGQDVLQGYYLLRDVTSLDNISETQSVPILVSSTYKVTLADSNNEESEVTFIRDASGNEDRYLGSVYLKSSEPTITKEVVKPTADSTETDPKYGAQNQPDYAAGDAVYYRLTADLPYYTGYAANAADPSKGRVYKITDTASAGLTVGEDAVVSVKVDPVTDEYAEDSESTASEQTLVKDKDYTVTTESITDGNASYKGGWTTTIDLAKYVNLADGTQSKNAKILEGGTVTVIIKATLNNNALISDSGKIQGNPSKDSLTYSNKPEDVTETHTISGNGVNVYTYRFRLHKTDKAGDALGDATFKVKASTGDDNGWLQWDSTTSAWTYGEEDGATEFTSGDDGEVVAASGENTVNLDRLDSGTYTVKETEAPDGYTQAFLPEFTFTINPTMTGDEGQKTLDSATFSGKGEVTGEGKGYVTDSSAIADGDDEGAWQYTIYNAKNLTQLPMTGGAGLAAVIAVGVLLGGAGIAAAVRSRKSTTRAVRA